MLMDTSSQVSSAQEIVTITDLKPIWACDQKAAARQRRVAATAYRKSVLLTCSCVLIVNALCVMQVAYIPQTAFIFGASVRDNILFGLPYESSRYQHAVESASLGPDLEHLPGTFQSPKLP